MSDPRRPRTEHHHRLDLLAGEMLRLRQALPPRDRLRRRVMEGRAFRSTVTWRLAVLAGFVAAVGVFSAPLAAQDGTFAPLDRAVKSYGAALTVKAGLEQTVTNPLANSTRVARGTLYQRGRNSFALRFTDPAGDAIVKDSKALWTYLPSTMPGIVLKLPMAAGASFDFLTQLLLAPRKSYDVTVKPAESVGKHRTVVYALKPKNTGAPFLSGTLWIGRDDGLLWQLETVEPSGLVRRVRFTSMVLGGKLPAGVLTFTVPPGVKVVDQAAMMGGKP